MKAKQMKHEQLAQNHASGKLARAIQSYRRDTSRAWLPIAFPDQIVSLDISLPSSSSSVSGFGARGSAEHRSQSQQVVHTYVCASCCQSAARAPLRAGNY